MIWHQGAKERVSRLIAETKPDIAHLHNIYHQLSPSILEPLINAGIPTLMTVHDYKLVCPNYKLFAGGAVCQRCVGSHTRHAFWQKCHKNSRLASSVVAVESGLHRRWEAYAGITKFIAPSQFMQKMLVQGGYPTEKISVLPHSITPPKELPTEQRNFMLYAGRLEPEKGLETLLSAARQLHDVPFLVAGDGSLRDWLLAKMPANVQWLGRLSREALWQECRQARALIIPSIWYEPFGMSALEAMAVGTPVIAGKIGGLPEIVQHKHTGLLVPPNNHAELANAIDTLWHRPEFARQLGENGQGYVKEQHNPTAHLGKLIQLFQMIDDGR